MQLQNILSLIQHPSKMIFNSSNPSFATMSHKRRSIPTKNLVFGGDEPYPRFQPTESC